MSSVPARNAEALGTLRAVAAAALYVACIAALHPYRDVFAFDPDEGINAIKAQLVGGGAVLYRDVWSDQPPLFTELLRGWCATFGWDVDTARALVLLFAAATVFAVYDTVRLEAGEAAAAAACVLLAASATFPRLSISLMIGLPAVALAMLSLWALFRWRRHRTGVWLIVAAMLMGASLATKLFTAMLVPVLAAFIAASAASPRRWRPVLLWLAVVGATTALLLGTLVGVGQLPALLSTHLAARRDPAFARFGAGGLLLTSLADWPLTLLGGAGAVLIVSWRRWSALVFPLWIAVVALCLLGHAPIWYHHELLFTVPFAAAAGIALAAVARGVPAAAAALPLRVAAALLLVALLGWAALPSRLPAPMRLEAGPAQMLEAMHRFAGPARTVVATDPMYVFRAGMTTPAALAVIPMKRAVTDPGFAAAVDAVFAAAPPELVLIGAAPGGRVRDSIAAAMGDRYQRVYAAGGTELLVRRDEAAR